MRNFQWKCSTCVETPLTESLFSNSSLECEDCFKFYCLERLCTDKRSAFSAFSLIHTEMVQRRQFYAFCREPALNIFAVVAIAYKVTKSSSFLSITGRSGQVELPCSLEGGLEKLRK